jgi:hypothetical protein
MRANQERLSFLYEPTQRWNQRKCSIYIHLAAALIFGLKPNEDCSIPVGVWLSIQFLFLVLEGVIIEMRERLRVSLYWSEHFMERKKLVLAIVTPKEVTELAWQFYGATLYFSKEATGCSDRNGFDMAFMSIFLLFAICKVFLLILMMIALVISLIVKRMQKRSERSASRNILRSLARIKYSALSVASAESDEECSICFCEYTDNCIVTKLDCNEKHIFHE